MTRRRRWARTSALELEPTRVTVSLSKEDWRALSEALRAGREFDIHGSGVIIRIERRDAYWPGGDDA